MEKEQQEDAAITHNDVLKDWKLVLAILHEKELADVEFPKLGRGPGAHVTAQVEQMGSFRVPGSWLWCLLVGVYVPLRAGKQLLAGVAICRLLDNQLTLGLKSDSRH